MSVAVLDVGKTNARLTVYEDDLSVRGAVAAPNAPRPGPPYAHADVDAVWAMTLEGLRRLGPVDDVVATTHGCAAALVRDDALALPVMDYEWEGLRALDALYDPLRPPFAETGSPALPGGQNLGRQLHWQAHEHPREAEGAAVLPYPQYWAWRLAGGLAADASSLGSHSDLWAPREGRFSSLARGRGWDAAVAPVRPASDVVGTLRPEVARATGLPASTRVRVGIHDSNASLLPLMETPRPWTMVSTGTWAIGFAVGGSGEGLDERRDCLVGVDVTGAPVPCARFMAGREFDAVAGGAGVATMADAEAHAASGALVLPGFVAGVGPYPDRAGSGLDHPALGEPSARRAAASVHVALMLERALLLAGSAGPVILDGPMAADPIAPPLLAAFTGREVRVLDAAGSSAGAARLALPGAPPPDTRAVEPARAAVLLDHRARWLEALGEPEG